MRQFIRGRPGPSLAPADFAAVLDEALASGAAVDFLDAGPDAETTLAFRLQRRGIGVHVLEPGGRHLATFSDPIAGAWHGFAMLDRAAARRHPAQPRRSGSKNGEPRP